MEQRATEEFPGWLRRYIFATDHKIIGIQFLFFSLTFFLFGGLLAMLIRWRLAYPDLPVPLLGTWLGWPGGIMPPEFYNVLLSMHATVMVFFVVIPMLTGAFGNYLIPLKIGARDMSFPFLNGLSFWLAVVAGMVLVGSLFLPGGAASAGWTSYPPLSTMLFNGGGGPAAPRSILRVLQVPGGTWPTVPIVINFVALLLLYKFIVIPWTRPEVAIVLAVVAAAVTVRGLQIVGFDGQSCWFLSLLILGFSNVLGAVNYLTTIVTGRCQGMTVFRLPMTVWNLFVTAMISLLATPVLAAVLVMNLLDHHGLTSFFEPFNWVLSNSIQANAGGGAGLLFPHLFWFYSHPAVYIMILPAMGIVSDILPVFSRKPLFGYHAMVVATVFIAALGFLVWGHHLFQSGMNPALGTAFAFSTMVIAAPSGVKIFNWLATMWGGNIRFTVPMLNAIAFVSLFVIGGLSGIILASTAVDVHLHMTYFVVAHIHYVLFGGSMFGIFAGIYFWYPKMFGRMMNPMLGYFHFYASFVAFNCTFFAMHILGLQGFPRRVADYRNYQSWAHLQPMNQFISISAFCLLAAQIPFIINFIGSWIWGKRAPGNPWESTTLEWTDASSPPAAENFAKLPVVYRGPYEYSGPLVSEDWLPQSRDLTEKFF